MSEDGLRVTTYFGERDRAGGRLLADSLMGLYERHAVRASALFRGIEGFGLGHGLQTERLLTLSEDLPMVAVAVGAEQTIRALIGEVREINRSGVTTLESVQLLSQSDGTVQTPPGARTVKLTIFLGRQERIDGRAAHVAVVDLLHRRGVAGASVLLGVDGTARGVRRRGRFFASNARVPLMVVSVGDRGQIADVLPELLASAEEPVLALEPALILKRDGVRLAGLAESRATDAGVRCDAHKLSVYAGEQARHEGQLLYSALIRRLRREGASGAAVLRGLWGYHGHHRPHGERFWSVRRHVPVVTVAIDTPANTRRWLAVVDEMTRESGLVTSESVGQLWHPGEPG
jgi:PII-like signaling protein